MYINYIFDASCISKADVASSKYSKDALCLHVEHYEIQRQELRSLIRTASEKSCGSEARNYAQSSLGTS